MLKRLFKLIAIVCFIVFVPYLAYLLINEVYPEFIFLPHGDNYYGTIVIGWLLGLLAICLVLAVVVIVVMTYTYIRYGIKDDSNEEPEPEDVELFSKEDIRQAGIECELNSIDIEHLIENL